METTQHFVETDGSAKRNEDSNENKNRVSVFRFKFTDEVVCLITNFAKVHQYDTREDYQEAWEEWVDDQDEMIYAEKKRLKSIGYTGDVEDKMYKAGRYYFRNKLTSGATEKKERRKYISTSHELIEAMDAHITAGITSNNYSPAEGFDDFCKNYRELLATEINNTLTIVKFDADEMSKKIKKTYKNRYFIVSRK